MHKDTRINGSLNVGLNQDGIPLATSSVKAHVYHAGSTGFLEMEARWRDQGYINFETNYGTAYLFLSVKNDPYMYCGNEKVYIYI